MSAADKNKVDPYKLLNQLDTAMYRYNASGSKQKSAQMAQRRAESDSNYERQRQKDKEKATSDYHEYRKSMGLKSNSLV